MPGSGKKQLFARSFREAPKVQRVADVDDAETVHLTVVLKPGSPVHPARHIGGNGMSRADYAARHGTPRSIMDRLITFATEHGLQVEEADSARHTVRLVGTYAQARSAFQPEQLGVYRAGGSSVTVCGAEGSGFGLAAKVKPAAVKQESKRGMFVHV